MFQLILTAICVILAFGYLIKQLYQTFFHQEKGGCSSCPTCEIKKEYASKIHLQKL